MILASTSMYERILLDPPTVPVDLKASTASVFDDLGDDVFNEMIRAMQTDEAEPLSITGSQLRSFAKATAEVGLTSLIPVSIVESGDSSRKLRQVNEARKIGVERSIDPAAFYTDDELYAELVRRSQAPREVAKSGIEMIRHVTPKKMGEMIMNTTLEPVIDRKMSEDPEFERIVRTEALRWKTAFRTLTGEEIVRFWGQDGRVCDYHHH